MATDNPLLVPIELKSLQVNQRFLTTNTLRWEYKYIFLPSFISPEPAPFTQTNMGFPGTGIMLHWTLPSALRTGSQAGVHGGVDFPLTPNRWLVVRYSGALDDRQATGWVVESDTIDRQNGGAAYVDPTVKSPASTRIGIVKSLDDYQPNNPDVWFLTAVAAGNHGFAAFQPFCNQVFSFFDSLDGVADTDTLSYLLVGWYSDDTKDFLTGWQESGDFASFLANAGWTVSQGDTDTATWALYHGMVYGISWDLNGAPPSNVPDPGDLQTAVGYTTSDALTALIAAQTRAAGESQVPAELIEALQYGALSEYDKRGAEFELKQHIEAAWFSFRSGGNGYVVMDRPTEPDEPNPSPISASEREKEAQWAASLNQAQAQLDSALATLQLQQWQLYALWWEYNFIQSNLPGSYPVGTSQEQYQAALDPTSSTSQIGIVQAQMDTVRRLGQQVPQGENQDQLQASITRFEQEADLPVSRQLKQIALRPFSQANDPVFLFQGLKADTLLTSVEKLLCRFVSEVVTGVVFQQQDLTVASMNGNIPSPGSLANLPDQVQDLLDEFFFLDPNNATMLAKNALGTSDPTTIQQLQTAMAGHQDDIGTVPDLILETWTQPWSPVILLWRIDYYPLPYETAGTTNWLFDGDDYQWQGSGFDQTATPITYSGTTFLTPQASFNFRAQLQRFIDEHPNNQVAQELAAFIENTDDWDFLSQSLVDLGQMMELRDALPNVSVDANTMPMPPNRTLAELTGANADYVPVPGDPSGSTDSPFQGWQAGQFAVTRMMVVDRFGQTVEVVNSQTAINFAPVKAPAMDPNIPIMTQSPKRFVQLLPRLLQTARLNFDFVSCARDNDHILGLEPSVNPVCAWILHNFLDQSIACYQQDGTALGEALLVTNRQGSKVVYWQPAPDSAFPTIQSLIDDTDLYRLGLFLQGVADAGPEAFTSLVETIDLASWNIGQNLPTADEGLALIAGKPLALVRTRVKYQLQGPPLTDPSWAYTFSPRSPLFTSWQFPVRLGEAENLEDGLVGYFLDDAYDTFYAAQVPDKAPDKDYVTPIGTGSNISLSFDGSTEAYVAMLVDPRRVVHATTGILPIISLGIPGPFVTSAFARMELLFRVGPLLSDINQPDDPSIQDSDQVLIPTPDVQNGTWSWRSYDGTQWTEMSIGAINPSAQFNNIAPILRSGLLELSGAIKDGQSPGGDR